MSGRATGFVGLLLVAASLASACSEDRAEAERVVAAVDRYRRAENADKPARADDLRAVPCSGTEICAARDACLAVADPTAKALRLKQEVEKSLGAVQRGELAKDSPEALGLTAKLDEADTALKQGFDHLNDCDDRILALKRKHRL